MEMTICVPENDGCHSNDNVYHLFSSPARRTWVRRRGVVVGIRRGTLREDKSLRTRRTPTRLVSFNTDIG